MRVGIVGGGIGGLTAALAFARRGAQVSLFEQAPEFSEVGAGIQISPNGYAVLRALDVPVRGRQSQAVQLMDGATGRKVLRMDLAGQDFWLCHRADLIAALAETCRKAGIDIHLGAPVTGPADDQLTPHNFDLIVGADGLHSQFRAALNGQATPFFTGQVAWRALAPGKMADRAEIHMGAGRHLVLYPLRDGGLINIVGVEERKEWADEGWQIAGDPAKLRAAFSDFAPHVQAVLDGVDKVALWGLHRHPVARIWHKGTTVLLGDAAHPTLPFLAQGANLALEDAWCLAACAPNLARYQTLRQARVTRAIGAANSNARNYHLKGAAKHIAHTGLRVLDRIAPNTMLRRFDWLYGYDPTRAVPMIEGFQRQV